MSSGELPEDGVSIFYSVNLALLFERCMLMV